MSNCSICGTVEYWQADDKHAIAEPYCPNCNPPATVVLPLDVGKDFDIDESEIHGMPAPNPVNCATGSSGSSPPITFGNDPNTGIIPGTKPDLGFAVGGAHSLDIQDEGDATLVMNGKQVLTTYEECPEDAEVGTIGFKKGVNGAHVFDGDKWQNLGAALRVMNPSKDDKCDRRAAIKATKAKNDAD